jgi:acyl carrier protein
VEKVWKAASLLVYRANILAGKQTEMPHKGLITVAALALAGAAGILVGGARRRQSRRLAAREYFNAQPYVSDQDFARQLGLEPGSAGVDIAVAVRHVLAKFGEIAPESLSADTCFYPDMGRLPFYDSLDAVELIMAIEEGTGLEIPDDVTHQIRRGGAGGIRSVGELARAVVALRAGSGAAEREDSSVQ